MNDQATTNNLFPGRPDYVGPNTGIFGLLHHKILTEGSHDVMERVAYVKREKLQHEVAIRLHNMIYLGGCNAALLLATLDADLEATLATLATLEADYEATLAALAPLGAYYKAKFAKRAPLDAEILAYIKTHIPDCAWDGKELVFA